MPWLSSLLLKIFAVVAGIFSLKWWGKASAGKEQAEKALEERNEDGEISSKPFIDDPLDRM